MRVKGNDGTQRVVEFALSLGFKPTWTRNGHLKFSKPERKTVFFSGTPGDHRAYKNGISKLRNAERGDL